MITEITEAAETSRGIRSRLVHEFHEELRQLIDSGVDESRKLAIISEYFICHNNTIKKKLKLYILKVE